MTKKYIKSEAGTCPRCGKENLDHGAIGSDDGGIYYPYTCLYCNFEGREWYNLTFDCHTSENGEDI